MCACSPLQELEKREPQLAHTYRVQKDWTAGNLGFDPLKLYEASPQKKRELELKEINNGRLAMLAITSFAAIEFITNMIRLPLEYWESTG